jgi:hypothetical protein
LAPDFRKNFKNFSESTVPAGARHRHPDDRAAISHPLYSGFFGKRSGKNGLFFKKVLIPSFDRPVHTQKIAKRSPPFLEKPSIPYIQNFSANDQRETDFFSKKMKKSRQPDPSIGVIAKQGCKLAPDF